MAENGPGDASGDRKEAIDSTVIEFLRSLSRIVRLFNLYPPDHSFVKDAVEETLALYGHLSALAPGVAIAHAEGRLIVEDRQISGLPMPVNDVLGMFRQKNVDSFVLSGNADPEEMLAFAQLLGMRKGAEPPPEAKFRSFADLKNIKVNEVTYKKVASHQAVVDRNSAQPAPALDRKMVDSLMTAAISGAEAGADFSELAKADPESLGREIHKAATRSPGLEDLPGKMLERAASGVLDGGGDPADVISRIAEILRGFPPDFVRALSGGASPADAPDAVAAGFSTAFKGRMIAAAEKADTALSAVAAMTAKLKNERENRADLLEAASISIAETGFAFIEAAPYALDLLEIDRRARRIEIEGLLAVAEKTQKPAAPRKKSVLLAEDSPVYQQFFVSLLDEALHAVKIAKDGKEAFDWIIENKPDLVVLDLKLPGMHGLEIVRQLRLRNVTPPLLVITEHWNLTEDFEIKTYPRQICLKKPPSRDAALKALRELETPVHPPKTDDDENLPEGRTLPKACVEYLEGLSTGKPPAVEGYEIAFEADLKSGTDAAAVDRFLLQGGRTGLLITSRSGIEREDVPLMGLFQTAARIVAPFMQGGKPTIIQAAGLLGNDRIRETPLVCQALILEPGSREIRLCTAGAPAPLRFLEANKKVRKVGSVGVTVGGLMRGGLGRVLEEEKALLDPGDILVLSSWGILRAVNPKGEQFGMEAIGGLLLTATDKSPAAICGRILQGVRKHVGEQGSASGVVLTIRKT